MLPLGDRNWQLMFPNYHSNYDLTICVCTFWKAAGVDQGAVGPAEPAF
jgi:hypothetical protein